MKNTDDLLEDFIKHSIARGNSLEIGDSKNANKEYKKINKITEYFG